MVKDPYTKLHLVVDLCANISPSTLGIYFIMLVCDQNAENICQV